MSLQPVLEASLKTEEADRRLSGSALEAGPSRLSSSPRAGSPGPSDEDYEEEERERQASSELDFIFSPRRNDSVKVHEKRASISSLPQPIQPDRKDTTSPSPNLRSRVLLKAADGIVSQNNSHSLSSTLPPAMRRGSVEYGGRLLLHKLVNGGIFLKFGSHGSPHYRFVCVDKQMERIEWSELEHRKVHGFIRTKDITSVEQGHVTDVFKTAKGARASDPSRCLSLVTADRTLDLECLSADERSQWIIAFHFLLHYAPKKEKRRASVVAVPASASGASVSPQATLQAPQHRPRFSFFTKESLVPSRTGSPSGRQRTTSVSPPNGEVPDEENGEEVVEAAAETMQLATQRNIPLEPTFGPAISSTRPTILAAPDPDAVVVSWVEEVQILSDRLSHCNREMKALREENHRLKITTSALASQLQAANIQPMYPHFDKVSLSRVSSIPSTPTHSSSNPFLSTATRDISASVSNSPSIASSPTAAVPELKPLTLPVVSPMAKSSIPSIQIEKPSIPPIHIEQII